MSILICGLLADTITTFPAASPSRSCPTRVQHPERNRAELGAAASSAAAPATLAYSLACQLGGEPPWSIATLGNDGQSYVERIRSWGASTEYARDRGQPSPRRR